MGRLSAAGHLKRVAVNPTPIIACPIDNAAGPFIRQVKYKSRNRVTFAILSACSSTSRPHPFVVRQYLVYQNKKKDGEAAAEAGKEDKYDEVHITAMEDGNAAE